MIFSLNGYESNFLFISTQGLRIILSTTTKPIPDSFLEICKELKIDINMKFLLKEQETISFIIECFNKHSCKTQYNVGKYRVDLYFEEYNLVIECDEFDHCDRDKDYELNRKMEISEELKKIKGFDCKFIRYNPDDKNFKLSLLINDIHNFMINFERSIRKSCIYNN